jgi:caspase-like apoptosis-related cysteine protease
VAQEDHSDADCIAVIVLTHGEADGLLVPRDSSIFYNVDMLWKPFTADKCPTLAGKPKLFFIQVQPFVSALAKYTIHCPGFSLIKLH